MLYKRQITKGLSNCTDGHDELHFYCLQKQEANFLVLNVT